MTHVQKAHSKKYTDGNPSHEKLRVHGTFKISIYTINDVNTAHVHKTNFLHCALSESITKTISTIEEVSDTFY